MIWCYSKWYILKLTYLITVAVWEMQFNLNIYFVSKSFAKNLLLIIILSVYSFCVLWMSSYRVQMKTVLPFPLQFLYFIYFYSLSGRVL